MRDCKPCFPGTQWPQPAQTDGQAPARTGREREVGPFPQPGETHGAPEPPSPHAAQGDVLPFCTQWPDRQTDAYQQTFPVKFPSQSTASSRTCSVLLETPEDRPSHRQDTRPPRAALPVSSGQITSPKVILSLSCHRPRAAGCSAGTGPAHLSPCPRCPGVAEAAPLPPRLQKPARWGAGADLPPHQALGHGKVPAESGPAEPGSSLCRSVTAWGRLRGAGRDRLASPPPTRLQSKCAEMLHCSGGPHTALSHAMSRVSSASPGNLRGTCSRFARSPRSPLQGTLQDHPALTPEQQHLLLIFLHSTWHSHPGCRRAWAKLFSLRRGQAATVPARRGSILSQDTRRVLVLPCTSSQPALVLQELPEGQGTRARRRGSAPDKPPGQGGSKKVHTRPDLLGPVTGLLVLTEPCLEDGGRSVPSPVPGPRRIGLCCPLRAARDLPVSPGERWGRSCGQETPVTPSSRPPGTGSVTTRATPPEPCSSGMGV